MTFLQAASPNEYDLGPDGHFYRTFNQCRKMSFVKAREICESTSGSVVLRIKSNSTQRFIDALQFLVPTQWKEPSKAFWLGLDRRGTGEWFWVGGGNEEMLNNDNNGYIGNWAAGFPEAQSGSCVSTHNSTWKNWDCTSKADFKFLICQLPRNG